MKTFSELVVVTVTAFSGTTTPDKNGMMPVMLQCLAGKMPNRQVLSGTVAERAGFEVGKTYLAQVREQGYDLVFGTAFTWLKVDELHSVDIINTCRRIGPAEVLIVGRPEGFEEKYQRKGNAVESLVTKRIQDGNFKPAIKGSDYSHSTASDVIDGTSTETDDEEYDHIDESDFNLGTKKSK